MADEREIKGYLFLNSKHSLAEGECYKIYGHQYKKFIADRKLIKLAYRFEELFSIVVETAFEFDKFVNDVANRFRYMIILEHNDILNGVMLGQKLFSFLSALGSYREAAENDFSEKCKLQVGSESRGWLDRCKCIRNYIIHVGCVPYGCKMNYRLLPTNDVLANARLGFCIDKLELDKVHPSTRKLFDEVYGQNEYVSLPELVANGLCAAGEIQKRIKAALNDKDAYKSAKKNQLAYDTIVKERGLRTCFALHGEFCSGNDAKNVGCLCPFPFTLASSIKAIEFLRHRYRNFNTRMRMYISNIPHENIEQICNAANKQLGFPPRNVIPLDVSGFIRDVTMQAYGADDCDSVAFRTSVAEGAHGNCEGEKIGGDTSSFAKATESQVTAAREGGEEPLLDD